MREGFPAGGEVAITSDEDFASSILGIGLSVFDEVEHFGVFGWPIRVRGKEAAEGEDEVLCGDGDAVGPFGRGLEVEGPGGEVFAGFPLGCGTREGVSVGGGVFYTQSFE